MIEEKIVTMRDLSLPLQILVILGYIYAGFVGIIITYYMFFPVY